MADEPVETTESPPAELPASQVTPSGGIITRQDGGTAPIAPTDWRSSLPTELQAEPTLARYKSLEDALKGAVHAQRALGKRTEYPGADAKPEAVAEFRKSAGVPDSPDKYGITLPQAPEGMTWDKAQLSGFLGKMHGAHARPEVVQAALEHFVTYMAQQGDSSKAQSAQEYQKERAAAVSALEAAGWGPQGGALWRHHETRALTAIDTLMDGAPPEAIQRVKESANDPEVAQAFFLLADALTERGFMGEAEQAGGLGSGDAMAKADAMRQAAINNPQHPLNDERHPDHDRTVKEYLAYHATAAGPRGRDIVAEVRR